MKLLLISNSGRPPYAHCSEAIAHFVGPDAVLGFVAAADIDDEDAYVSRMREVFTANGIARTVLHLDWRGGWREALDQVGAVFVGGGNTYVLLDRIMSAGLGQAIREAVRHGVPYLGTSAGANIAGPTILTTNDWNVTGSTTFAALALVPFNINPHYAGDIAEAPTGETRDERIHEYRMVNDNAVLGIQEGTLIEIANGFVRVLGAGLVRVFASDGSDYWVEPGQRLAIEDLGPNGGPHGISQ